MLIKIDNLKQSEVTIFLNNIEIATLIIADLEENKIEFILKNKLIDIRLSSSISIKKLKHKSSFQLNDDISLFYQALKEAVLNIKNFDNLFIDKKTFTDLIHLLEKCSFNLSVKDVFFQNKINYFLLENNKPYYFSVKKLDYQNILIQFYTPNNESYINKKFLYNDYDLLNTTISKTKIIELKKYFFTHLTSNEFNSLL